MRQIVRFVQSINRAEKAARTDGTQLARECIKTIYVHLVPEGDGKEHGSKRMWTVGGKLPGIVRTGHFSLSVR